MLAPLTGAVAGCPGLRQGARQARGALEPARPGDPRRNACPATTTSPLHLAAPARSVAAAADRRDGKGSSGSDKGGGRGGSGGGGGRGGGGRGGRGGVTDVDARTRQLQSAARRASARAEGVGSGRVALQERLAAQDSLEGEGWGERRQPQPQPQPQQQGKGSRRKQRGGGDDEEEELWPSREAVAGPPPPPPSAASAVAVAGPGTAPSPDAGAVSAAGRADTAGSSGRAGAGNSKPAAADTAGLVAALRAAATADRQARMMGGGGAAAGTGAGSYFGGLRNLQAGSSGSSIGSSGDAAAALGAAGEGGGDEALVPYVDVVLQEMGLPPRASRRGTPGRGGPQNPVSLPGSGSGPGSGSDDEDGDGGAGSKVKTRGRGAKRGALRALLGSYQAVWCRALDLELQEEWTESEERLKTWKRSRLEAEGAALFDLAAAPDHALFRDAVLRFYVPGRPLPFHCLGAGDIVLVSPHNKPGESSLEGVVLDYSSRWLRVALPADLAAGVQGSGWRLDLYANTIAHERARGAVKRYTQAAAESGSSAEKDKDKERERSGSSKGAEGGSSNSSGGGGGSDSGATVALLRALAGSVPAGSSLEEVAAAAPPWLRGKSGRERLTAARRVLAAASAPAAAAAAAVAAGEAAGDGAGAGAGGEGARARGGGGAGLNPSQARAVETALGRSLTLWQGPPGTGKTATLLRFIHAALAALPGSGSGSGAGPLLATAASNVAVDNLVAGLRALDPGLDVVRVGQPAKLAPELRGVSLEARIAGTGAGQRAARLRKQAQGLRGSEAWKYISQALELEEGAARDILSRAQVVAATCIGAGEARLQTLSFPVVVLDEATQATEPHSLVPLLNQAQQVVLVGDPRQLPPTVKSREAEGLGLGLPLFERLQLMGLSPLLLDTQYRMHPAIAAWPSAAFYQGKLTSAPKPSERRPPAGFPWPNPKVPVCFIPVRGRESRTSAANDAATPGGATGFSYQNDDEAGVVAAAVAALLAPGAAAALAGGVGDIGIITPYNGQVRCLQQLLTRGSRLSRGLGLGSRPGAFLRAAPSLDEDEGGGGGGGGRVEPVLEVKSVDGFQGREKEVIVFSAVRSNPEGRLGFVSDPRRLNVAITRAKRGLVVVGNPDTLMKDRLWARWLRWVEGQGCVLEGGLPGAGAGGSGGGGGAARGRGAQGRASEAQEAQEEDGEDVEIVV